MMGLIEMRKGLVEVETTLRDDGWYVVVVTHGLTVIDHEGSLGPFATEAEAKRAADDLLTMLASIVGN